MEITFNDVKAYAQTIPKLPKFRYAEDFKEFYDEMAVHTRKRKPKDLLLKRRPNEPDDVYNYRLDNYEPITYGSMNKAFDNLYRIVNGINYSLGVDDEIRTYMGTKSFMKNTFDLFFTKIFLKRMIEDPNGFIAWLPGGEGVENGSKKVYAYPVLLFSFNMVDWSDDFVTFLSEEKTIIKNKDNVQEAIGLVYYIFSKNGFYKLIQKQSGKYELVEVYVHNLGEFPLVPMGGDLNSEGYFESFFAPYVAFGNESIRQFSDWQAISTTSAFPIREEFFTQCDIIEKPVRSENSLDKLNANKSYSRRVEVKPISKKSPFESIQREVYNKENSAVSEAHLPYEIPSLRWLSPGVEYVKNAEESYKSLLLSAEDALHLNLGNISLSGKAKEIDLLSHEDMLGKISIQYLDAQQTSARILTAYKNASTYDEAPIKLTKPNTFRIKTEEELMAELTAMKNGNAPAMLVGAIARELAARRFSGDLINQKIFEITATFDPLYIYSLNEKQTMFVAGYVNKDDVTKSVLMYSVLLNLSKKKDEVAFLEMPNETVYNEFLVAIKPYLIQQTALTNDNGLQM
jgi:hypothetical protein